MPRAEFARSAVSNGTRLHQDSRIDGRTAAARRFRDLTIALATEAGGTMESLNEGQRALIRGAASLMVRLEQQQAALASGQDVDPDLLIRLNSEARRALGMLQRRTPEPRAPSLSDYLASRSTAA